MKRKNIIYIISVCILLAVSIVMVLCLGRAKDTGADDQTQPSVPGVTAPDDPLQSFQKATVSGKVLWTDGNDQDGKRPGSVVVRLWANGKEAAVKTVTTAENWAFQFSDLDKFVNGKEIVYTITQDAVVGYEVAISGFNATNSYTPEQTRITVQKTWVDNGNQDGKRPVNTTVHLYKNGEAYKVATLTANMDWEYTFENLPVYEEGKKNVYTITEDAVEGYVITVDGFRLTGTHQPEKTSISGNVTWNDENNQDGKRPASIMVSLLADGQKVSSKAVTAAEGWKYGFAEQWKYANGREIVYSVTVDTLEGYTTQYNGFNATNYYTPQTVNITVQSVWTDNNNQDGKRPTSITIHLWANGVEGGTKAVTAADSWKCIFENLPAYKNGAKIVYTVTEEPVPGYTISYNGFQITNFYTPGKIQILGNVIWNDRNDQDGKRPESITIRLWANGQEIRSAVITAEDHWRWGFTDLEQYANGKEIVYSITQDAAAGYTTTIDGCNVTNSYKPEETVVSGKVIWADGSNQDGKRPGSVVVRLWANGEEAAVKTVTAAEDWKFRFSELDKFVNGKEIVYAITQDAVAGYAVAISGFNVTNSYTPEQTQITVNTIWADNENRDGKRPTAVTIRLHKDGNAYKVVTLNAGNGWRYTFEALPAYESGRKLTYTITEDAVEGYTTTYDGFNVINSYETEQVTVTGNVTWNDAGNQDGKRPASTTVHLWANGIEMTSKAVTAQDGWTFQFAALDRFSNGEKIVYTITQDAVAEYATTIDNFCVTNSYTPEQTQIAVQKTWIDNDNQDGKRPVSITVRLYKNGEAYKVATLTANMGWKYTFENLPVYEGGKKNVYTITEDAVAGYVITVDGFLLTGTHQPEKTSVSGSVTWNDGNNQDGKRPASITVNLLADGRKVSSKAVTAAEGWKYSFAEQWKYANGRKIVYSVTVDTLESYTTQYDGFNVTNSRIPQNDEGDVLGPAFSIILRPEASGTKVKSNNKAIIDYSNVADGYVMVKYTAETAVRLKVQVTGPSSTAYTYDITVGQWEVFPLSDGNGSYRIRVLENVVDNRYATVLSVTTDVTMKDEYAPFIRPNQYVNYENAEKTVTTGAELCRGKTKLLDKVEVIYQFVVKNLSYDYDKAATVQSGYLPDLDAVLAAKKGICFDYAALMTAMLRSQGIPCKLVIGYAGTVYHAWISVWSEETGWVDGVVYFNGTTWQRMDPTFISSSGGSQSVVNFVKNDANYTTKYLY